MITHTHIALLITLGVVMGFTFWRSWFTKRGRGVSIIIPFRASKAAPERLHNVTWLMQYWKKHLPGAEVIMGEDPCLDKAFSKSVAINAGVKKSTGDVLVIMDADGFMRISSVMHCVNEIRLARKRGHRLWFIPYRQFYRLSEAASKILLASDPADPHLYPEAPEAHHVHSDTNPRMGHWYGAMVHIVPREAFELVGGWDERFRGWGGEDHAAMRAMDTLYWHHKTLPGSVLHVWHPMIGGEGVSKLVSWKDRRWEGQDDPASNNTLSWRYYHAFGKMKVMRKLVDEWPKIVAKLECGRPPLCPPDPPKPPVCPHPPVCPPKPPHSC
jgi:hypothetical protein